MPSDDEKQPPLPPVAPPELPPREPRQPDHKLITYIEEIQGTRSKRRR
jgi:hypothetical protein